MNQKEDVYWEVALEAIRELDRIREIELDFGCWEPKKEVKDERGRSKDDWSEVC
jgi:hypothetical protein